jgi:hypothetical protein
MVTELSVQDHIELGVVCIGCDLSHFDRNRHCKLPGDKGGNSEPCKKFED